MKTLEQIQKDFCDAILHQKSSDYHFISSSNPMDRVSIYKNTIFDALRKALAVTFPGVWILLGEECADNLARAFCSIDANLPFSGCLDDWGAQFPDFIYQQESLKNLSYLKDFAEYEWLKHLSYSAASVMMLESDALVSIAEENVEALAFTLHPSVFIMMSQFALDEIVGLIENPGYATVNSISKKTYALVARPYYTVLTFWVGADLWLFIDALLKGNALGESFQAVKNEFQDFDLTNAVHFLLQQKLLISIEYN